MIFKYSNYYEISSAEFYKVVNRFFRKIEIQNPLNKFEKFEKKLKSIFPVGLNCYLKL
jgi:hypothetical protein